ncbi:MULTISPECIES: hypothetical protein [Streptomyces]|nr:MULTISPECIES: hypothetical protein [Streptomyces]MBC2877692.1 hypothetical protein [Streptomyces sp. TYQ1024]UBI38602.1 hypothetical protein K7I03_20480 [Streptomyces mobaraensis]UKW31184.1 hypothetical protein MCU78_20435 [Streptomyces sp. TYQ1024]
MTAHLLFLAVPPRHSDTAAPPRDRTPLLRRLRPPRTGGKKAAVAGPR